jgi:hypothetical protein
MLQQGGMEVSDELYFNLPLDMYKTLSYVQKQILRSNMTGQVKMSKITVSSFSSKWRRK